MMRRIWDDHGVAALALLALLASVGAAGLLVDEARLPGMTMAAISAGDLEGLAERALAPGGVDDSDPVVQALKDWAQVD